MKKQGKVGVWCARFGFYFFCCSFFPAFLDLVYIKRIRKSLNAIGNVVVNPKGKQYLLWRRKNDLYESYQQSWNFKKIQKKEKQNSQNSLESFRMKILRRILCPKTNGRKQTKKKNSMAKTMWWKAESTMTSQKRTTLEYTFSSTNVKQSTLKDLTNEPQGS